MNSLSGSFSSRHARARALVMAHGWNAVSYQILNPGIELWFAREREAVVGFVRKSGVRVVAGAPICAPDDLELVVAEWERDCRKFGEKTCYFGAAGRLYTLLSQQHGYATVVLGAQPMWKAADWAANLAENRNLRAQLNRAKNKGVQICEWPVERARGGELDSILKQWLRSRGLPSLHFLVEPRTLHSLGDRRLFVAEMNGNSVGFCVLAPIPDRNGFLTEQFVRGAKAPNGTVELMLFEAIRRVADEGADYLTMGLVPLSQQVARGQNPLWLGTLLYWLRSHGARFYNFGGLEEFKAKFEPREWEPIYAISNEARFSPRVLWAIASAFSRRPLWLTATLAMRRAIRQEVAWWREKR